MAPNQWSLSFSPDLLGWETPAEERALIPAVRLVEMARLVCRLSASRVGGKFSKLLPFCISCCHSFNTTGSVIQ